MRSLVLSSSSLLFAPEVKSLRPPRVFDLRRLAAGTTVINVDVLTICIDEKGSAASNRRPVDSSIPILPSCYRSILTRLDPNTVIFRLNADLGRFPIVRTRFTAHREYVLSCQAATHISQWSRLRVVYLDNVNVVKPAGTNLQHHQANDPTVFFLRPDLVRAAKPKSIRVVWDLSNFLATLPAFGSSSLLDLILSRDSTLFMPWLESFVVVARDEEIAGKFEAQVTARGNDALKRLRWVVKSTLGKQTLYA